MTKTTLSLSSNSYRPAIRMVRPVMLTCTLILAAACASTPPPTEQLAVSAAAVAHAVSAGSTELAPMEMKTAREKLDKANIAMTAKDYGLALALAKEAQIDAQLAESRADSSKSQKAASEIKEDSRVLREEINRKSN